MWATVRAWHGSARAARCRFCHKPIVWVMLDTGKQMPFNLGFMVREIVVEPTRQARFAVLDKDDRHDCPERKTHRSANTRSH